ncbi:MAG: enoyl-CoA hydratase-related protein [Xenophilus sp.]
MSEDETALLYRRDGHVARITFNRPAALNAIDAEVARRFFAACSDIAADADVRAVVIDGAGRSFVAGGDLKAFQRDPAGVARDLVEPMHAGLRRLAESPAPVLASVHGAVAGAGLSLVLACDLAIAAEGTRFNLAYLNVGASSDLGASWTLPRVVGLRKAAELALLNPTLDADEACRIGMVNWVVPAESRQAQADAITSRLVDGPPLATGRMKRLLREAYSRDFAAQLDAEREAFDACTVTEDFGEAVEAFFAKRPARYRGR